ncbi:tetraacyldisaccharide 4'-kinase [Echinimonas agarilytica]|uniref:Tetraacyldisaccharide 4'-kinase n=1 Tax=Echinimonas agarilytica TaxID=1215918 RepID=A0AA42B7Q5_9GAMM|nr:tetraacyldisaccharide 4'-kinase [Echinimonas agarilytica]MCM2679944.1 tetraacyldisaccharide 4'-kinase [Echinimonas agarilytica]
MQPIQLAWQQKFSWTLALWPVSLLFSAIAWLRRTLYQKGLLQSYRPSVPVIVVGNITVGGSGKTPTVLWLIELLKSNGYKPAVVSRGYGGKAPHYPFLVTATSQPAECGDEPLLIAKRTNCIVVVDPLRTQAAQKAEQLGCDVIVADDGLQHYALQRDIELVVIDGQRRFGNGYRLPAGPLREGRSRLTSVFACISNGGEAEACEWAMSLIPASQWMNVNSSVTATSASFAGKRILLVAGIGDPTRFFDTAAGLGVSGDTMPLDDHAEISESQYRRWQKDYDVILMTEKDAVKCSQFEASESYYLPVNALIDASHSAKLLSRLQDVVKTLNSHPRDH